MFKHCTDDSFLGIQIVCDGNGSPGIKVLSQSVLSEFTNGHGVLINRG
jgi:hypothetical protein